MRVSWRALLVLAFIASLVLGEGEAIRGPVHRAQGGRTVASQGMATEPTGYLSLLQADLPLLPDFILTEALQPQQVNNVTPLLRGGEGVKVGIIDSFAGFQRLLGTELPPPERVVYRSFTPSPGATAHGTAVAEIIHDLAPMATLYLAEATTVAEVAQAVDWLISQGVHIINMSLNAPFAPPSDGRGLDAITVEKAAAHGILWVNSAGNYGNKHWRGPWRDPDGDLVLDFRDGLEANIMKVPQEASFMVVLRWENPWPGACDDYDLTVQWVDPTLGTQVRTSEAPQDCSSSSQPLEMVSGKATTVDGRLFISVRRRPTARPVTLELFVMGGVLEENTPHASVAPPADSAKGLAVGAAPYYDLGHIHPYSARGPGAQGVLKPDFVGPDTVSTATFGPYGFAGTSAAAAHIAGLAAVIKGARPQWGPQEIREALKAWAWDMGPLGPDTDFGYGSIDPTEVARGVLGPPLPPAPATVEPYDDQLVQVSWQARPEATHYLFCLDLRADFSSPYASCRKVGVGTTALLVEVPKVDQLPYYFRVHACNENVCSVPHPPGGLYAASREGRWAGTIISRPIKGMG